MRKRWVIFVVVLALLMVGGGASAWFLVDRIAGHAVAAPVVVVGSGSTQLRQTPSQEPNSSNLSDTASTYTCHVPRTEDGYVIPSSVSNTAERAYRALRADDLDTLRRMTINYDAATATGLHDAANRRALMKVLCEPPAHYEGWVYYDHTGATVDIGAEGADESMIGSIGFPGSSSYTSPGSDPGSSADSTSSTPDTSTPAPESSDAAPSNSVPTLGRVWSTNQQGYGTVRPDTISNGGDPTGLVTDVRWHSWGGSQATADGTSTDASGGQSVAESPQAPAKVVAFDLGTCQGQWMYRKVEWYFPGDGQHFDPQSEDVQDICTGS